MELQENEINRLEQHLLNTDTNKDTLLNLIEEEWRRDVLNVLRTVSIHWSMLSADRIQQLINLFVEKEETVTPVVVNHFNQLEPELRIRLLPLLIKNPSEEITELIRQQAEDSETDAQRCSYLGALTILGDQQAAEALLEMEAILGELTTLGKDLGKILFRYLLSQGEVLVNGLLVEGNINKVRAMVKHLKRIREFLPEATEQQQKRGEKLLGSLGRMAASYLQSGTDKQRRAAVEILAISPIVIPLWLTQAFRDKQVYVRAMVMRIINSHLNRSGAQSFPGAPPDTIAKLVLKGLQDPSPLVREKAVLCLKNVTFTNKFGYLHSIARSEFEVLKVRLAAISTLTELLPQQQVDDLLFELKDDRRLPIRLFVRELEFEIHHQGVDDEETNFNWVKESNFLGNGYHTKVDRLLAGWLEQLKLPVEQRNDQGLLRELACEAQKEYGLRQILDFYQEWEERLLTIGHYRESVDKLEGLKSLLGVFNADSIPMLTAILAVEKDLHLRLAAIEALSELVLEGVETEHIKDVLLNHLIATNNPPDQERILSVLYVFPRDSYIGLVVPMLSSASAKVAVQAASILSSFDIDQVSCYNAKRVVDQIMRNVSERMVFGKYWADLTVYTAQICAHEKCGDGQIERYLDADDYMVKRFAKEVKHHIAKMH